MTQMRVEGSSAPRVRAGGSGPGAQVHPGGSWARGPCSQHAERGSEASVLLPPAPLELTRNPPHSLQSPPTHSSWGAVVMTTLGPLQACSEEVQNLLKKVELDEGVAGANPLENVAREFHPLPATAVSLSDTAAPTPSPFSPSPLSALTPGATCPSRRRGKQP